MKEKEDEREKEKERSIIDLVDDILKQSEDITYHKTINKFTSLVPLFNFIALKMLFTLKKITEKGDDGNEAIKNILRSLYTLPDDKIEKMLAMSKKLPDFAKDEDLLSSVISSNAIIDIFSSKNVLKYDRYLKYTVDEKDRIEKEIEDKNTTIARLFALYMELIDGKEKENGNKE